MSQELERAQLVRQAFDLQIRSMRRHRRGTERLIGNTGLHQSQHMILMILSQMDFMPSQRELADRFNVSAACIARSLKPLVADGYITRSIGADDQRCNHISVTEKGLNIVRETRRIFDEFDMMAFEGFSMEELKTLVALLSRLQDNLKQYEDPATEPPPLEKGSVSP